MPDILVDHTTFAAMVGRAGLCVFNASYAHIRKYGDKLGTVWPTVRAELQAFLGLLPILQAPWHLPW